MSCPVSRADASIHAILLAKSRLEEQDARIAELEEALKCAQNVLLLLTPEIKRMGCGAFRVYEKVNAVQGDEPCIAARTKAADAPHA
jgi:hypothetical protein